MLLSWRDPCQRATSAFQARLCLSGKEVEQAPQGRRQSTQQSEGRVICLTCIRVASCYKLLGSHEQGRQLLKLPVGL